MSAAASRIAWCSPPEMLTADLAGLAQRLDRLERETAVLEAETAAWP